MMCKFIRHALCIATLATLGWSSSSYAESRVHIFNWSDYIAEDTLENFTKTTGIKTIYDVFDSNETLEGKLLAGSTGYDIVVPSSNVVARLIRANTLLPLDRTLIPNWQNLDPKLMQQLEANDPGNRYSIPYMGATIGIGYNVDKVKEVLGVNHIDSWAQLFEPENAKKLSKCGISLLDSAIDALPSVLNYLGLSPFSQNPADYKQAEAKLLAIRPYITYFHSSKYISDLANGNICIALGYSGDVLQATNRAKEANKGIHIAYAIPKEGAGLLFDMLTIPKDAQNVKEAHAFINYLLEPKVTASISNHVQFPNAVPASRAFLTDEVSNNPAIYPHEDDMKKLYISKELPDKILRLATRTWTRIKTNK